MINFNCYHNRKTILLFFFQVPEGARRPTGQRHVVPSTWDTVATRDSLRLAPEEPAAPLVR